VLSEQMLCLVVFAYWLIMVLIRVTGLDTAVLLKVQKS